MKVLRIVLIACALSAAVAHAQTAPSTPQQKAAQANNQRADSAAMQDHRAAPAAKAEECVGPMSFCNIYFGS
ncbi:hypothetical protein ACTJLC_20725 [Paraburkholderia sp. 22099]|jgi:hypothetical protein|uniref:hypothetical protein n=1 Tax=Paraburkholderia TaxID=1822464 RepID=UPI000DF00135|nr:hypothetical protein [Paraburkholderia terricola]AXE94553.1 hypothetical protein CUJ90_19115 [Paraburkholderia terricola]MDR6448524.1 hypothetical protein [Paraburkholderia terricola]MDR6494252.1 hypothetical protein [Paraburkholderia terricola]